MNDDKWNWTEPDPDAPTVCQKERGGMIALLIIGSLLIAGGVFFAWKIGAFDHDRFWGLDTPYRRLSFHRETLEYSLFFHAPWLIGCMMVWAALRNLCKLRKK